MFHSRWQRSLLVAALLFTTMIPFSVALAAPAAGPSCLQTLKQGLGTVLPGSSAKLGPTYQSVKQDLGTVLPGAWSGLGPTECLRLASADAALIPVSGGVGNSVVWRDAGAGVSAALDPSGGWRDAGAGSR